MTKLFHFLSFCVSSSLFLSAHAVPVQEHQSGGVEHIVIIDNSKPKPPGIAEVLNRLALNTDHPDVKWIYNNSAFTGFSASMKSHCLDLLANMTDVSAVEKAVSVSSASFMSRDTPSAMTRGSAPWGLQSISSVSNAPTYNGGDSDLDYTYRFTDSNLGAGSDIYILDTGIYLKNNIFSGRAEMVWSYDTSNLQDMDGHGTHVAGTAGGEILGVASNANIFGVKGLDSDGTGWSSNVIAGIDFVIQQHEARKQTQGSSFVGSVLSMSLASGSVITSIDQAVSAAISAGLHVCVAAGNEGKDACGASPASAGGVQGGAISVGAVDIARQRASFSNTGACVDLYAPGVDVVSAWIGAPNMINRLSGTSMATPHVTGMVAYLMAQNATLAASPALMKQYILDHALPLPDGTRFLNNGVW